jgi:hypothetical protein
VINASDPLPVSSDGASGHPLSVATLLQQARAAFEGIPNVTVAALLGQFGLRGFAVMLCVLSLLNLVLFMLPGLSILFGVPMVLLALQMVLGKPAPVLPSFLAQRTIRRDWLDKGLAESAKALAAIEPYLRPRLTFLSGRWMVRLQSGFLLALSLLVAVPIPFANMPPSLAVVLLGLGLMQRDGVLILTGDALAFWSFWLFGSLHHLAQGLWG